MCRKYGYLTEATLTTTLVFMEATYGGGRGGGRDQHKDKQEASRPDNTSNNTLSMIHIYDTQSYDIFSTIL